MALERALNARPPRAVVFDLDGTLVDSLPDIAAATNHALGQHGLSPLPEHQIAGFVGDGARLLIARAAQLAPDEPALEPLLESFIRHYAEHPADRTRLLPGAAAALAALAELPLALCTNKPRVVTEALLARLELTRHFSAIVAGGDLPAQKPDPLPLTVLAERLGVLAGELVMVGDGPQDVEAGRRAGAYTVGVLGGIASRERLLASGPDVVIESLAELRPAIERWRAQATSA